MNALACARARALVCGNTQLCIEELNTGYLVFSGAESQLTCAVGVGNSGPLNRSELNRLADFFLQRGSAPSVHVTVEKSQPFVRQLFSEGYLMESVMGVMVSDLRNNEIPTPSRVRVEEVAGTAAREWVRVVSAGWANRDSPGGEEEAGAVIAAIPGVRLFLAREPGGAALGGGAMIQHGDICIFFGDSTLPRARGCGVQTALIRRRAREASRAGKRASAMTLRDSASERNYVRSGFHCSHVRHVFSRRANTTGPAAPTELVR